jgi:phosphatidylglycerol:prolipoprotein diacylglycerol transferase
VHPVLIDFGAIELGGRSIPLLIGGYGVMFAVAIVIAWLLATRLGSEIAPRIPWTDLYFLTVLAGFLGARITNVLISLPAITSGRKTLVGTLLGGGVWFGGVVAGSLAWYALARSYKLRPGQIGNLVFVVAPLAHAIGRVGCLLGGCCYGTECSLPWAVTYTDPMARRLNGTPLDVPLHPTVVYESLLELVNFALCYALWKSKAKDWAIVILWMGLYGSERFLLEFLRGDPRGFLGPLSTSQWLGLASVACSAALFFSTRHRGAPSSTDPTPARAR